MHIRLTLKRNSEDVVIELVSVETISLVGERVLRVTCFGNLPVLHQDVIGLEVVGLL